MTPDEINAAIFKVLESDLSSPAADALNAYTRAKMAEPAAIPAFLDAVEAARSRWDAMTPEERATYNREMEEWEAAARADLLAACADPARWRGLCEAYCHEGLSVLAWRDDADGVHAEIEFGLCSKGVTARVALTSALREHRWAYLDEVPAGEWPPELRAGLAEIVDHIRAQVDRGATGC